MNQDLYLASRVARAREITEYLLPTLKLAAGYADRMQSSIQSAGEKTQMNSVFGAALTDADISVQNMVEVALLTVDDPIHFFGEEYAHSRNMKYFPGTTFEEGALLGLLDPIDGTKIYEDGKAGYQIVFSIADSTQYLATIVVRPSDRRFYYAELGAGVVAGDFGDSLLTASKVTPIPMGPTPFIHFSSGFDALFDDMRNGTDYRVWSIHRDYEPSLSLVPCLLDLSFGQLDGGILRKANLIDAYAFAFMAQQQGYVVTDLFGKEMPPLSSQTDMKLCGFIVARTAELAEALCELHREYYVG